jgi:integrase
MAHRHGRGWRGSVQAVGSLAPLRRGGFPTRAAAERWERDTAVDLARGSYRDPDAGAITFEQWAREWTATRGVMGDRTRDEDASIVRVHLVPAFGPQRLDSIGPLAVRQFVSGLAARRAPKTVRNVHGVLHNVMALAVAAGRIPSNPCQGTKLPDPERRKVMACLTEQQLAHLVACTPEWWRPLVVTLAGTGLRWGEAVGLTVEHVDLLVPEVRVRQTLNPTATRWKPTPKTKAGRRNVGLPRTVVDQLLPLVAGKGGGEPVFTTPDGALVKHRPFNYSVWQPACRAAGVKATPHDLRHSHAALLIANGVPMPAISQRLGHASIKTTFDTYGYLLPRVEADLLAGLDRALAEPGRPSPIPETAENPA